MEQLFEVLMIVCFGVSWPFNIAKSWKAKTARGKSLLFEVCILVGYLCGIAGKFITGNVTYVLIAYVINLVMVTVDVLLTMRNMALDKMAERKAAKEKEAQA
jgi:hypothetical protein